MNIEELTKEELVIWIRENVPGVDEEEMALWVLERRSNAAWEKYTVASQRFTEMNSQIINLFQPYADGPLKPGVKLRRFSASVQQEYNWLDQARRYAQREMRVWLSEYISIASIPFCQFYWR